MPVRRYMLSCLGFPGCKAVQFFPASVLDVKMAPSLCSTVRQSIIIHVHLVSTEECLMLCWDQRLLLDRKFNSQRKARASLGDFPNFRCHLRGPVLIAVQVLIVTLSVHNWLRIVHFTIKKSSQRKSWTITGSTCTLLLCMYIVKCFIWWAHYHHTYV